MFLPYPKASLADSTMGPTDVHLFCVDLDADQERVVALQRLLSAEELQRANQLRFDRDRRRFVVSHGLLRLILSGYSDVDSHKLQFNQGPHGKPALSTGSEFNLSHSNELALIGITTTAPLGVDVEFVREVGDAEGIARRFLSKSEQADLLGLPRDQWPAAFFSCWTRKESYLKALGYGLSVPLDDFTVTLLPEQPARLCSIRQDPAEASEWTIRHLEPKPGYTGALAIRGHHWRTSTWSIDLARIALQ